MSDRLPQEIVEEILHRLPVKSLVKFITVCRAWNSLITNRTFVSDHLNRTIQASNSRGSLFFQFSLIGYKGQINLHPEQFYSLYSVNQQTDHFSVERFPLSHLFRRDRPQIFAGTCNGLVCAADYSSFHSTTILIWNPLLRKYLVLPKPIMTCKNRKSQLDDKYHLHFGFGFDSKNNDYKVIRLMILCAEQDTPHVEVYSLVSRSWRIIDVTVPPFYICYLRHWFSPVTVNGAVHWVVGRRRCDGSRYKFILSFDVIEETFGELMLPQQSRKVASTLLAVEGGHSLSVVNHFMKRNRRVFSVWVMKKYGIIESWTEVSQFDSEC
ncbi:F-box/kelch-repeat protein At3g23880-like [Neltuma alba]|uniref:F-box/kelch-repeat protein At3g23880-like n=1 Tax=Neltuma alba TaxID=207710 RepID=UPI0010A2FC0E|nr:F-box/kelch-repeat protein At3g23880-like [Prosopis alba]